MFRWIFALIFLCSNSSFAQSRTNPDISVNFLGLYLNGNGVPRSPLQTPRKGPSIQEAELQFFSAVDAYFRASALFSVSQEPTGEYGFSPEEVYIETTSLPMVTIRAGKMKLALGKHNQLHTHAFPFLNAPLVHKNLLGDEGLNESGVSASALLPLSWFSEFTIQATSLRNDSLFGTDDAGALGTTVHWKNLWDINDDTTFELGLSHAQGENQLHRMASVNGADFTFKWRPSQGGLYHALIWSTELLDGYRPGARAVPADPLSGSAERLAGFATWIQYQFAQRWWVEARYEISGTDHSAGLREENRQSYLLGFFPTEFSGFRIQYDHLRTQGIATPQDTLGIQYNVTLGAHPAHSY